jgi:sulfide:quinone oxidoreductase
MGTHRVLILGAGFGGLELASTLSERFGSEVAVTLIDKSDYFMFGYSKLDVLFGRKTVEEVKLPYRSLTKPGVRLLQETITSIDAANRRVTTSAGTHEADYLVIALGADYDVSTTPGIVLGENEFYSVAGAAHLRTVLPTFKGGNVIVGVCSAPYKCPPAPSECALMLHDYLVERGLRDSSTIKIVNPLGKPVPPSPETSEALLKSFAERGIEFIGGTKVVAVDAAKHTVTTDKGEMPCDLFLGIPKNRAPDVVVASGLTNAEGWVNIDPRTLLTSHANVWAIGDLAATGTPKAGVFAETAARTVADNITDLVRGKDASARYPGSGSCYIEFGSGRVARIDVDFFSGPAPTATFHTPSQDLRSNKDEFGTVRKSRWFGL